MEPRSIPHAGWRTWMRMQRFQMLVGGIAMVWVSQLFFAHGGWTWFSLLFGGMAVTAGAWVAMAALGWRSALAAAAIVALGAWQMDNTGAFMQRQSFRLFVAQHEKELASAVRLLEPVEKVERRQSPERLCDGLPAADCAALRAAMDRVGSHVVWKKGGTTVFELYGWVDGRGGIAHCPDPAEAFCARGRRVTGDWYRWRM